MPTATELLNHGDRWSDRTARLMLPILAHRAMIEGEPICYSDLDHLLVEQYGQRHVHAASYGHAAGRVGDVIALAASEMGDRIPPLNVFLVNKYTRIPGAGADQYVRRYVSPDRQVTIDKAQRKSLLRAIIDEVKDFPKWEDVLQHLGLQMPALPGEPDNAPIERPPGVPGTGGGEGPEHRALKEWVRTHPELFRKYGAVTVGESEKPLDSGDSLDVFFQCETAWLAVEVKPRDCPEIELWRGVFQCVKYRATLQAMRKIAAGAHGIRVLLVVEHRPTDRVISAARRLGVEWRDVSGLRRA